MPHGIAGGLVFPLKLIGPLLTTQDRNGEKVLGAAYPMSGRTEG